MRKIEIRLLAENPRFLDALAWLPDEEDLLAELQKVEDDPTIR